MPRTYYRGPDAVVTGEAITGLVGEQPEPVKFTELRLRDKTLTGPKPRRPPWHGTAAAIAVVTVTAILAALLDDAVAWIPGGVLAAGLLGHAWRPARPRRWEWHATTHQGTQIVLYANYDKHVFDLVTRALRRAIEDSSSSPQYQNSAYWHAA